MHFPPVTIKNLLHFLQHRIRQGNRI